MNLNKYTYVIAVAEAQNMRRAAEMLYISQPALTKSLNLLEEELGVKLFDRNTSPIRLTYAGELFVEEARKILDLNRHLMEEITHIATVQKSRLVLGIPSDRGSVWLPHLIPAFSQKFPLIDLQVVEGNNQEIETFLLNGDVDLALNTLPFHSDQISFEVIADDPIVIAAAKEHPFCQVFDLCRNTLPSPYLIPAQLLKGQNFIALKKGTGIRRISEYLFERYGLEYTFSREFLRHETTVRLAAEGVGLVITPAHTVTRTGTAGRLAFFSLDQPVLCRKIVFAHLKSRGVSSHGRFLIQLAKDLTVRIPGLVSGPVVPVLPLYR